MKLILPTEYISITQAEMHMKCGKQYEFRYVDGLKSPPSIAMVSGQCGHHAIEHNNSQKITSGIDLPKQEVIDLFADTLGEAAQEVEERYSKDEVIQSAARLLDVYMEKEAPNIMPVSAEEEFTINLRDGDLEADLYGIIDVTLNDGMVSDYKFTSKAKSQSEADSSLQLQAYAMAKGADVAEFICLVDTKEPKVSRIQSSMFTKKQLDWTQKVIMSTARQIAKGNFPLCHPSNWWCSYKFCGYWHKCRGKK